MKIEIKSRWNSAVLFSLETSSIKLCLEAAIKQGADLRGAYLRGADLKYAKLRDADLGGADLKDAYLRGANLGGADLRGAYLEGADLRGAYLEGADLKDAKLRDADLGGADLKDAYLRGAYLEGADLKDAKLRDADLGGADLKDANLRDAYLGGADLRGAYLRGAYLRGANLQPIRDDLWAVLSSSPAEAEGLRQAIIDGKIDGSTYTGECACLVGTLANVAKKGVDDLPILKRNSARPAERFFLAISKGDTPKNNQISKLALEWVNEWLANIRGAFAAVGK